MPVIAKNTQAALGTHGSKANLVWSRYAPRYDEMCTFIPAYQENIDALIAALPSFGLPDNPRILDLGGGTGNYCIALGKILPQATFTHVDVDPVMNEVARVKYDEAGIDATVIQEFMQRVDFESSSFDLIICVNSLCHASPQGPVLRKMNRWLTRDGTLFLIDFGRPVRLADWGWYIFRNAVKKIGLIAYLKALIRNRQTFFQNRRAKQDQNGGAMWLHSPMEFQEILEQASFDLSQFRTCYRGYCDLAICRPRRARDAIKSSPVHLASQIG